MEIIVTALLLINLLFLIIIWRSRERKTDDTSALMLKQDLTTLTESMYQLKDGLQSRLDERLDKSNEQMLRQFSQSAAIIKDVTQKPATLEKTNQQVGDIAGEL